MEYVRQFESMLQGDAPVLALAPMQDVTDLPFWQLMSRYGGPDLYYTEYFRVYPGSCLDKNILRSVTENPTGKPAIAQMIGNDIPSLVRTALELQKYPVAAVDLNLGCPAPIVYRKCAGGGLLREPHKIDAILAALRQCLQIRFTVKSRIGFDTPAAFNGILEVFGRHKLDLVTIHGRTVAEMYRSAVHYDYIEQGVQALDCPVLANGNVYSAAQALRILQITGAKGLMIGRGAIRNPWLFKQIRQALSGESIFIPTGRQVLEYIVDLYHTVRPAELREAAHVQKMKKYMNYIGLGIEPSGEFLHQIRRVDTEQEFFKICERWLDHREPMPLEPFALPLKETDVMAGEHA